MRTLHSLLLCIGLACATSAQALSWIATQLRYDTYGWETGQVHGLNNLGQVIGIMEVGALPPRPPGINQPVPMAFVTGPNGSNLQPISSGYEAYIEYCRCTPGTNPRAINDAGQIVTLSYATGEPVLSLAGPGGGVIPPPPSTIWAPLLQVGGLNSSGQIAGTSIGPPYGFLTDANGNNPHVLGMLDPSYENSILAINDSGQLLVRGVLAGTSIEKTFVTGANATGLAFEPSTFAQGLIGLNNSAQLLGQYVASPGGELRAFITSANGIGFTDIGNLGGPTFASALSNSGFVTGTSGGKAFIYGYGGNGIRDLNQLVTLRPGEFLTEAPDVNDLGQIVAMSNLGNIYLLSPVPEPATHAMLVAGIALVMWRARTLGHVSRETPA